MSGKSQELEMSNASRDQLERWSSRRRVASVTDGLAEDVVAAGGNIEKQGEDGLNALLLSGEHSGMTLSGADASVCSLAGAQVKALTRVEGSATFSGVVFSSVGRSNHDPLVSIGPKATVLFVGCVFLREQQQSPTFVVVDAGGKAVFSGCRFGPRMNTAGSVIANAGIAGDVGVIGVNDTGNALGTVTAVFVA